MAQLVGSDAVDMATIVIGNNPSLMTIPQLSLFLPQMM